MTSTTLLDLMAMTTTIVQEAGAEPFRGQLAVAHVIMNRAEAGAASISDVVFRAKQFSCWNEDSPTRLNLDLIGDSQWRLALAAAAAAYFRVELDAVDPTGGATHFLNVELTKKIRGGSLPSWAAAPGDPTSVDPAKAVATIGHHVFLKL